MVNINYNWIYTPHVGLVKTVMIVSKILIILPLIDIKLKIFYTSNVVEN
jgi:hypothetical protein